MPDPVAPVIVLPPPDGWNSAPGAGDVGFDAAKSTLMRQFAVVIP
ncbi:hypothetical protein [Mycobacterium sp. 1081908.1]|nr:hypothetical protein [Mycobacterium sp. 1081908.1]